MKLYYLLFFMCSVFVMSSCYADKGNYTYISDKEVMPVEIGNIRDTTVVLYSLLNLEPPVKGLENKEDYEYVWYTYRSTAILDTLSREYSLKDHFVDLSVGTHRVRYSITSKKNGVSVMSDFSMRVASEYNNGWFLLKEQDGNTDLDFVYNRDSSVMSDIVYKANGFKLEGTPVGIVSQEGAYGYTYETEEGELEVKTGLSALHLLSSADIASLDPITMKKYYHGGEMFYYPTSTISPTCIYYDGLYTSLTGMAMVSGGKLYSMSRGNDYMSRFAYPVAYQENYRASDQLLYTIFAGILIYDEVKECFMGTSHGSTSLSRYQDTGETYSPHDMNHRMVRFLPRNTPGLINATAFAVMQDNQTGTYRIFNVDFQNTSSALFNGGVFDVPDGSRLPEAKYMEAHFNLNAIYFSTGDNILYVHNTVSSSELNVRERVEKTFPSNEKIVFIKHLQTRMQNAGFFASNFVVVTQDGNRWKLYEYKFDGSTPQLESDPVQIHEGDGKVGYALKMP